jgi:copper chaperone CopZ
MKTTTIAILNLKCGGCANSIKKGLQQLDGITAISVDLDASTVQVDYENDPDLEAVRTKLAAMGYPEEGDANTLLHKAKSFVSCASGRMSSES